jgi:hypothetical protein
MTTLTIRAVGWLQRRAARRRAVDDDRGLETAEVLLWLAATAGIILALTGQLQNILDGVLDQISGLLG